MATSSVLFDVPRYSQFLDVKNSSWRRKSCGIASLKMIMDFYGLGGETSLDELLQEGLEMGAYREPAGWYHKGLVCLAEHHGLEGNNFDWAAHTKEEAFKLLASQMAHGPVIASIYADFEEETGGHLVVLTGIDQASIFFNDPAGKSTAAMKRTMPRERFLKGWKRRIIVVHPPRQA